MITMSPQYIEQAGGILRAISLKSAEVVRDLLQKEGINIKQPNPRELAKLERLLVHTAPHLDEYMAVLLFRACLPQEKLLNLPLEEFTLTSSYNDYFAKVIWPTSAVFGMGGTQNGGAKALFLCDEHVQAGTTRQDTSCAMLASKKYLLGKIPIPLFKIIAEVDHIDANGNAHPKHLGKYIGALNEAEYLFSLGTSTKDNIKDVLTPMWKQALVEACLAAFILGINDKKNLSDPGYWKQPARDSMDHYAKNSLLKDDPKFSSAFKTLKYNISNYKGSYLTIIQPDGTKTECKDKKGRSLAQLLAIPYLAALCQDYWGPYIGHIVMAHFWEARLQTQIAFEKITDILRHTIGDGSREIEQVRTPVGELSLRHVSGGKHQQDINGKRRTPWIIELIPNGVMPNAKAPLLSFLNSKNDGVGYILLRNPNINNVVLNKGRNGSTIEWEILLKKLIELEGNSDEKGRAAGCWHVTENSQKKPADFLLNGNRAHQYVPRTSLDAESLVELVSNINV